MALKRAKTTKLKEFQVGVLPEPAWDVQETDSSVQPLIDLNDVLAPALTRWGTFVISMEATTQAFNDEIQEIPDTNALYTEGVKVAEAAQEVARQRKEEARAEIKKLLEFPKNEDSVAEFQKAMAKAIDEEWELTKLAEEGRKLLELGPAFNDFTSLQYDTQGLLCFLGTAKTTPITESNCDDIKTDVELLSGIVQDALAGKEERDLFQRYGLAGLTPRMGDLTEEQDAALQRFGLFWWLRRRRKGGTYSVLPPAFQQLQRLMSETGDKNFLRQLGAKLEEIKVSELSSKEWFTQTDDEGVSPQAWLAKVQETYDTIVEVNDMVKQAQAALETLNTLNQITKDPNFEKMERYSQLSLPEAVRERATLDETFTTQAKLDEYERKMAEARQKRDAERKALKEELGYSLGGDDESDSEEEDFDPIQNWEGWKALLGYEAYLTLRDPVRSFRKRLEKVLIEGEYVEEE